MGTHPIFESDFDCLTEMSDSDSWESDSDASEGDMEETEFDTTAPKPIKLKAWVNSAKFHPEEKLLVAGDFDGFIKVWSFDNESEVQTTELKLSGKAHSDTIRAVDFSKSGRSLFSIGTDRQLLVSDVESGKAVLSLEDAFESAPYCIDSCNDNVIATGDESGVVRLFDIRKKNPVDELLIDDGRCEDTINDIHIGSDGKFLVAASADGTLCAYNCKRRMFLHESQSMGADLCSIASVKNETKAVVSCSNGTLQIYNWGEFGHPSDMFPGHDAGDLCLTRMNEKIVLTGDFRGNIRPVNIQPNRIMGILGVHQANTPIECLDCFKGELALSVGTGHSEIRFWNTKDVKKILEGTKQAREPSKASTKKKRLTGKDRKTTFYSGFGENLDEKIELKDQHHSSDEEKEKEETEEKEEEEQNEIQDKDGPKSSDSCSDDNLAPQEASTSELESDHKSMKRPPVPPTSSSSSSATPNGKKKRRKKTFKPLL